MIYNLLQPFIFLTPPEKAHCMAMQALELKLKVCGNQPIPQVASKKIMGLDFPNPIGLAAGFDKNGEHVDALGNLGFGFIEIGGVTPKPQAGNPQPRIFRLPQVHGLINRMGFNNVGANQVAVNLKNKQYSGIIGINLGKNATTPHEEAINDFLIGLEKLHAVGDFFTINVSSPNTANLREWQHGHYFLQLLTNVLKKRDSLTEINGKRVPILVKISPDNDEAALNEIINTISQCEIDGVIACNTTVARPVALSNLKHGAETGGLSGQLLGEKSTRIIRLLRQKLPASTAIIGVGGIMNAEDMHEKLAAGADLIQFYTGLVYNGPSFAQQLIASLNQSPSTGYF